MNLFQMSVTAGFIIIATVLLRAVALNKLPKAAFLALWGVALFRLLVPFAIPARFGFHFSRRAFSGSGLRWFIADEVPTYIASYSEAAQTIRIPPIAFIWLSGTVVFAAIFAVIYFLNHRRLRDATPVCGNDFLREWLGENGISRSVSVVQSEKVTTPIAVGLLKPRIVLPRFMDMSDERLLRHVLMHELCHIRRFDALWKMLLVCAVCVHWFNPLVWLMFVVASRDLELTCDEMVIRRFGAETKSAYAYALIEMAEQRSKFALLYNAFGKNAIAERIEAVMRTKRISLLRRAAAFVLVAALAAGALFVQAASYDALEAPRFSHMQIATSSTDETFFFVADGMEYLAIHARMPSFPEVQVWQACNEENEHADRMRFYSMYNALLDSRFEGISVTTFWNSSSDVPDSISVRTSCQSTITFRLSN